MRTDLDIGIQYKIFIDKNIYKGISSGRSSAIIFLIHKEKRKQYFAGTTILNLSR